MENRKDRKENRERKEARGRCYEIYRDIQYIGAIRVDVPIEQPRNGDSHFEVVAGLESFNVIIK